MPARAALDEADAAPLIVPLQIRQRGAHVRPPQMRGDLLDRHRLPGREQRCFDGADKIVGNFRLIRCHGFTALSRSGPNVSSWASSALPVRARSRAAADLGEYGRWWGRDGVV